MPRRPSAQHHDYSNRSYRSRPVDERRARLGPIAFWVVIGTLVVMTAWTIATVTYFAFREDVLAGLLARQAQMQYAYEDRIAELRARIDRFSSRQAIDQEEYDKKLEQILRRQAALESRAGALNSLGDATASIKQPPARGGLSGALRAILPKSVRDKRASVVPSDGATIDSRTGLLANTAGGIGGTIERVQASLDRLEQRQTAMVGSLAENYDAKARRMRGVLVELGLDVGKGSGEGAVGGPFVPVNIGKEAMSFERQVQRVQTARAQVARLTRTLASLPVRKPVDGELDPQSGFGVRTDPFLGSPAMHTGLDLHGETGDAVRATADGTVVAAGWSGGYGRVVDIDHHNGLLTRYGHLSSIDVRVGQSVKSGQIVGKVGSTGRSTGPHLHYETRLKGEAVDPQRFLRAGEKLAGNL
jgi:murein DD-endopeptidase MepM/ murein hydrolase activator NlpD